MQVSVETLEGLERSLKVTIPAEQVISELNHQFLKLSKSVALPGFRQGKVPLSMVKQRFDDRVRHDLANKLMENTIENAVTESKIKAIQIIRMTPQAIVDNQPFVYEAVVEVFPEFTVKDLKGVEIERLVSDITEDDIEKMMSNLRKQRAEWADTTRKAANGDKVTVDFAGSLDGVELPQATTTGFELELGSNSMIPGFEDAFVGMKIGDEKTVDLTFPAEYHAPDLAGKVVQFKLALHAVKESKLPELDDAFAQSFESGSKTVVELRDELVKSMKRELTERLKNAEKQAVFDKLIELNEITPPKALVREESQRLARQMLTQYNIPREQWDKMKLPLNIFTTQAERNVRLHLILAEYIKANSIDATEEEITAFVDHIAESYEEKQNMVDYYLHNQKRKENIRAVVTENNAVAKLLASAKVKDMKQSYEDVMKAAAQEQQQ